VSGYGPPPRPVAPPPRARVAWGLPDVAIAFGIGILLSLFAVAFAPGAHAPRREMVPELIATLVLQSVGILGALIWIARNKGLGSLFADFGFVRPDRVLGWGGVVIWLAAGVGLSVVAIGLLRPIVDLADLNGKAPQDVSKTLEAARGFEVVLLGLGVGLLAPVVEELLFRGALLRALLRRTTPPWAVLGSALIFAAVHVVGDPGAGYVFPGLLLLGLVSGYEAYRTGNLGRSMLLHIGFNLLSTIFILK
jgi:membrane protease YdiL (CAAX protease family)